ncbi:MAG TPA: glycoside hydrolase family 25 protein [Candidatus Nitrosotalea sp.]|nr:glycoside hydrolase family 25 protein [Candidatus Nitrosotalea sp.]
MTFGIRLKLPVLTSTPSVVWGIDVSAFQHPNGAAIDWAQVGLAGVKQAYIQASQGTGVLNPYFADDVAGARAAAIPVGAYHLCYPALNTPAAEVAYFRTAIAGVTLDLPAMLDDETKLDKAWVLSWFALWGDTKALHYSDASYLAALGSVGQPQWTARPGATGLYPGDYATQYASAPVPGIVGNVDLDYFDPAGAGMTEAQMQAFLDGLAKTISGQTSFAGWMASVLTTEQNNFNSLAAIEKSVAALGSGGGLTAAQAAQVSAIQADLAALIASLKNA